MQGLGFSGDMAGFVVCLRGTGTSNNSTMCWLRLLSHVMKFCLFDYFVLVNSEPPPKPARC